MSIMMNSLTIFFDHECALCCRFRTWLEAEPCHLDLRFVSYRSSEARAILPEIDDFDPGKEILILGDNGTIYQGPDAWIVCLWATREYRHWADRFAKPAFRPLVRKLCLTVSASRLNLSALLPDSAGDNDRQLVQGLEKLPDPTGCGRGECQV